MSEPNWPIRVGGEYEPQAAGRNYSRRVIAIDGETVYSIMLTRHSDGTVTEHSISADAGWLFRRMYRPEDQSPIPALVEALKESLFANGWDDCMDMNLPEWVVKARAALVEAGALPEVQTADEAEFVCANGIPA